MEKLNLRPYEKESMKMAMLKHEETFREQVYELHRLYQIQKNLMKNIASSRTIGENPSSLNHIGDRHIFQQKPDQNFDLERPAEAYTMELDDNGAVEIEEEAHIELTLGPSSFHRRRKSQTPLTSDSGLSFSSSSSGSSHIKKIDRTRKGLNMPKWGLVEVPESNPSFLSGRRNNSNEEDQLRQDRLKESPWLFQVLSLNMT